SSGGFGSKSQANQAVIPSRARDLTDGAQIARDTYRETSAFERSLTLFGMTRAFIFLAVAQLFRHRDFSSNAASFNVAIVHRLREHRRDDELAAVARLDLIIDLQRVCRRGHEKHRAIFADIHIIDAMDCRRASAG